MRQLSVLKHILTPETEKDLFGRQLADPLLRGENITIFSLPHCGIREKMNFLIKNSTSLIPGLRKTIFVYLDPNEIVDNQPQAYFRLMGALMDGEEISYRDSLLGLREKVKKFVTRGYRLVFILGYFYKLNYEATFFDGLFGLHQIDRRRVNFIFTSARNIFTKENIFRFGQLTELLLQNIVYFPLFSEKDSRFVVENLSLRYHYPVDNAQKKLILAVAGGHPTLILHCLRIFSRNPNLRDVRLISQKIEIKMVLENIWESFTFEEKNLLLQIANKPMMDKALHDHLLNLGVIKQNKIYPPLLANFINTKALKPSCLTADMENHGLLVNGSPPKGKITARDYRLLSLFLKKPGQIISRDEIAETLWQENSYDKYSDWAIDRAIFALRKRLKEWGVSSSCLQTTKGLGYRWID